MPTIGWCSWAGCTAAGRPRWPAAWPPTARSAGSRTPGWRRTRASTSRPSTPRPGPGGPGRFARDPAAHLTERSPLLTPDTAARLLDQWRPHWDLAKPVLVEVPAQPAHDPVPPGRLSRRPLRHGGQAPGHRQPLDPQVGQAQLAGALLDHWFAAHRLLEEDAPFIHRLLVVKYEHLVGDPGASWPRSPRSSGSTATSPPAVSTPATQRHLRAPVGRPGRRRLLAPRALPRPLPPPRAVPPTTSATASSTWSAPTRSPPLPPGAEDPAAAATRTSRATRAYGLLTIALRARTSACSRSSGCRPLSRSRTGPGGPGTGRRRTWERCGCAGAAGRCPGSGS